MKESLHVLIVDDSEQDALLVLRALQRGGLHVAHKRVEDEDAMRAALAGYQWDVILCDYEMPQFNGLLALTVAREMAIDLPFIIVSGAINHQTAVALMKAGAQDYILKDNLLRLVPAIEREMKDAAIRQLNREAQAKIKRTAEEWATTFDSISDLVSIHDKDFRLVRVNQAFADAVGTDPDDLIGKHCYEVVHGTAGPIPGCPHQQALNERKLTLAEVFEPRLGIHLEVSASPTFDVNGKLTGSVHVAKNVTERRKSEDALRESEQKLQALMDAAPVAITWADLEGNQKYINHKHCELFGYTLEEIPTIAEWRRQAYPDPAYRETVPSLFSLYKEGKEFAPYEATVTCKDGTKRHVKGSGAVVSDTMLLILDDITFRKQAEHLLERIFLNAPTATFILQDKMVQMVNTQFEKLTGYGRGELAGLNLLDTVVVPDDRSEVLVQARRMLKGEVTTPYEYRAVTKSGDRRWFMETVTPIQFNGRDAVLGNFMDITDRKALQVQLTQAQKLESIGQLAAGIAHEINTPTQYVGDNIRFLQDATKDLVALLGQHRLLVREAKAGNVTDGVVSLIESAEERLDATYLMEEIPKAIEQSLDGIAKVTKIVRAMKEFSHPGTEEKTLADINKAIENTITISRNEWKYVSDIVTDLDPSLPLAPLLLGELSQVLLNIIVNAAHAIEENQRKGRKEKGIITVKTSGNKDWVEIRIGDNGAGMPADIKSRIFDPFFTTKEVGKGTGQGLAIAHSVVVGKHQGTIHCESEPGKGSTFIINLPARDKTQRSRYL